jgi:N-acetylmuramic acid 6-phosphate (MurNAc-6-P) etherase
MLLQQAGGETKIAIVVGRTHVTPEVAQKHLAAHGNILRDTLEALEGKSL